MSSLTVIKNYKNQYDYAEVSQERKCKFAFGIRKGDEVHVNHYPVLCRDFLNDTLVWREDPSLPKSIYGYTYHGEIETEETVLVIFDTAPLQQEHIGLLNQYEDSLGIKRTVVTPINKDTLVVGDKFWMKNTVLFSWYTTMLRALTYRNSPANVEQVILDGPFTGKHDLFAKVPKLIAESNIPGVRGAAPYCGSEMYSIHDCNGWLTASKPSTHMFNNFGKVLYGNS